MRKYLTLTDPVVPMHHPRALIETAMVQGANEDALLEDVGIVPATLSNPEARISYGQFGILTRNALRLTNNPALGLDFGTRIHVCHLGVLGLALMSSPTARAALDVGLRYYRALAPAWDMELTSKDGTATLTVRESLPFGPFRPFAAESLLAAIRAQSRFLLGDDAPLLLVALPYRRPAHAARYHAILGEEIFFDQPCIEVSFEDHILDRPLTYADPVTASIATRQCAEQMPAVSSTHGLLGQVRQLLAASPEGYADLDALAKKLQTSARSLRRALQQMGTSYQKVLDDVRQEQAVRCIVATHMTSEQLAMRLGFRDVRSFRRAFKRWTGHTPQSYRTSMTEARVADPLVQDLLRTKLEPS